MSKEIYISSTPHETRLAIVEDEALTEIYYERENEYTLAGSIYNGRVTRVLPGMQSSFVDIGLERDAFLYITDFMEETPDPDEFDTATTGDRAPRAPRLTNGGDQSGETAVRTESGPRSSERGDRGGRGRRGGRDRDRNQDRGPIASDAPRVAAGTTDAGVAPRDINDTSEVGEGAPGADGNRRWRGRRGRRRGRSTPGQPGDPTQESTAPADSDSSAYPEDESSYERESYMEIDAAAPASAPPVEHIEGAPRSDRSGDRGRRDQGRNAPRRDGQRRDQRPEQRAPRGFTPSRDLYGVDSGHSSSTGPIENAYPDENSGAAIEPIILPGESLSKYRKGEEQAAPTPSQTTSHAIPVTLAPPATLYTIAEGWDGGATLPGETLSRRRPSESAPETRRPQRDFDREPRRDARPDRGGRAETRHDNRSEFRNTAPAAEPVAEQSAVAVDSHLPPAPEIENVPEPTAYSAPATTGVAPPPFPEAVAAPEPTPHVEVEYEPAEASVSYRVDPAPPSEFRQSAPVLELPVEEPPVEIAVEEAVPVAEHHDITAISPTGEMFSEPVEVLPEVTSHPAPIETPEPTSPIHHEGAILTHDVDAVYVAPATSGFAPGTGQLDEEFLDDEDSDGATLHASSIEELDDLEEEALEGAADLGTMLREMSIDHITRTMPEVEDEDDTEEDDLEEDDLEEDEEEEDEEDEEDGQEGFQLDPTHSGDQSEDDLHEQAARTSNAADAEFFEQQFGQPAQDNRSGDQPAQSAGAPTPGRDSNRDSDRRGGRRDGRRGRSDRSDRDRSSDRNRGGRTGHSNGHGRHSMQSTNLPAISDLLKPGQEILVQIAKEPIAKKGARITSHIALPGRFLVFMPTVNHTGVSRKIESDGERRRLKEILLSEKGEATGGFIVRTAAEGATEEELRSDLRFLLNLWADIKNRSESSKSPALIYHDLNLIERVLRDQVTDNFSAIWVDTETEYERVLRFLQRFQPSLIRRVKLYSKDTPLFEQFGITEEINKALRSKVWLKSGGSIVINQTEALVAIDINTGKFVGKTARLEDTIVKTNLDAIPEIVRQIRLRDLGGIIIIDFIDMDERKNRNRVMAALEDELKSDRAPSKVLQFNDFGLVAITRKRVKQSLERTLSTPCTVCTGTGMVKSPVTVCNDIYIEMRKMHKHLDRGDVMLRVHPEVVKQLKSSGAKWLQEMEEMAGKTILVKSDPSLHPEQFDIH